MGRSWMDSPVARLLVEELRCGRWRMMKELAEGASHPDLPAPRVVSEEHRGPLEVRGLQSRQAGVESWRLSWLPGFPEKVAAE